LDEEAREIEEGLRRSALGARFEVKSQWAVRPRDIRRALLDYEPDIVHFSGHGAGDEGLVFENDIGNLSVVPTDALASLFELFSEGVRCVLLNACFSEVQARAIAEHIQHVVGMQWEIGDRAAIEFAVGFYDALGAGKSVPIAHRFGCNAIRLVGLAEHGTPVLLTRLGPQPQPPSPVSVSPRRRSEAITVRRNVTPATSALAVATIDDVVRWGWDRTRLLEELIRLDYETTDGLTSAHEGDPHQWGPVFMTHPDTWRLLTTGPESIVGYWHWAPLFPAEYHLAKTGALLDSMITVDTVQYFELPGVYDLYFVQICMLPEHRRPHALQRLFDTVFEVLDGLSQGGVYVREISANAYTAAGEALCKTFGMRRSCPHQEHGSIYVASIGDILQHPVAQRRVALLRHYRSQGLA
jgi:hypothetical protein